MAIKAVNKDTGATVTADEVVIGRLGPEWQKEKQPARRAKSSRSKKSDE